jgi:hypothetical protein
MIPTVRLSIRLLLLLIIGGSLLSPNRALADQTTLVVNKSWKVHVKITTPPSQQGDWLVHLFGTPTDVVFADGSKRQFAVLLVSNSNNKKIVYKEGEKSFPPLVSIVTPEFDATLQRDEKQITFTIGGQSQAIKIPGTTPIVIETEYVAKDTGSAEVVISPDDVGPKGGNIPAGGTDPTISSLDKKLAAIQTSVDNSQSAILFRTLLLWLITLLAVIGGTACLWFLQNKAQKALTSTHVEQKTIADGYDKRLSKMDNTLNTIAILIQGTESTLTDALQSFKDYTDNRFQEIIGLLPIIVSSDGTKRLSVKLGEQDQHEIATGLGSEIKIQLTAIVGDPKQLESEVSKTNGANPSLVALLANLFERQKRVESKLDLLIPNSENISDKLQPVLQQAVQAPAFQAALKQVAEQVALKAVEEAIDLVLAEKLKTALPAALLAALQNTEVQSALKRDTPRAPEANSLLGDGQGQATDGNAASVDPSATRTSITSVARQPVAATPPEQDPPRSEPRNPSSGKSSGSSRPANATTSPMPIHVNNWRQVWKDRFRPFANSESMDSSDLRVMLDQIQECNRYLDEKWESLYGRQVEPKSWDMPTIRALDFALYYEPDLTRLKAAGERDRLQPLCEVLKFAQQLRRQELADRGITRIEGDEFVKGELESSKVIERTTDKSLIGKVARIDPGDGGYRYKADVLKTTLAVFYAPPATGA